MIGERIVVGVDYSDTAIGAAEWVCAHLATPDRVTLAHAVDLPPIPSFLRPLLAGRGDPIERVLADEQRRLDSWRDAHCGRAASSVVREGRTDLVLGDVVRELRADLLAIGAHRDDGRAWMRLGTTAERLLRAAEVSLLVAHGSMSRAPKRILVAVDDADITPRMIAVAGGLAKHFKASLHAVHVLSNAAYSHVLSMEAAETHSNAEARKHLDADMAAEALRWLSELWKNSGAHDLLSAEILHGRAAGEILQAAVRHRANLIVTGRYGAGRVLPAVLGSVVGSVVHGALCPVLVVADTR